MGVIATQGHNARALVHRIEYGMCGEEPATQKFNGASMLGLFVSSPQHEDCKLRRSSMYDFASGGSVVKWQSPLGSTLPSPAVISVFAVRRTDP